MAAGTEIFKKKKSLPDVLEDCAKRADWHKVDPHFSRHQIRMKLAGEIRQRRRRTAHTYPMKQRQAKIRLFKGHFQATHTVKFAHRSPLPSASLSRSSEAGRRSFWHALVTALGRVAAFGPQLQETASVLNTSASTREFAHILAQKRLLQLPGGPLLQSGLGFVGLWLLLLTGWRLSANYCHVVCSPVLCRHGFFWCIDLGDLCCS